MMGLLDAFKQYISDVQPGGLLNPEIPKGGPTDAAKTLLGFTPAGDVISLYDGALAAKHGDWLGAGLGALGAIPLIPNMAGVVHGGKIADALNLIHGEKVDAFLSERDKAITLSKVVSKEREKGAGTAFMQDLIAAADREGKRIDLSPSVDFGGNKKRLEEFYKRFGFVPNTGKNKDYEVSEAMYRSPVQPKPYDTRKSQQAVSENIKNMPSDEFAPFSYLFAPRQAERTVQIQTERGGRIPERLAVEVSRESGALHPFDPSSRPSQGMQNQEIAGLLSDVYHGQAQAGGVAGKPNSIALVNTKAKGKRGTPTGIFYIDEAGEIQPATAYPSSDSKVESLLRKKKKGE